MAYLDNTGLTYFYQKIKALFSLKPRMITVTLTVSGWSGKTQTVTVSGVTASNMVVVSVDSNINGIECTAQGTNTLTFTAETTPTANVTVKVAIIS